MRLRGLANVLGYDGMLREPFNAPPDTPAERHHWLLMMVACWVVMAGALLASTALIDNTLLLAELCLLILAAFPVVRRMHFSTTPRLIPNWTTFLAALILGLIHWRLGVFTGDGLAVGLVAGYRTLVSLFYWVMAFRAFALRSVRDLTQTALPAASGILLVLIAAPGPVAYIGTALVIGGTLALLAGEHATARREDIDEHIPPARVRGGSWRPVVNSWISLLLTAAVAAVIVAAVAAHYRPSNDFVRALRRQLTWRLARLMMHEGEASWTAESTLALGGPAPKPRDQLMLEVRCETPVKPRIAVYDIYDGHRWRQSKRLWRRLQQQGGVWRTPPVTEVGTSPGVVDVVEVEITPRYGFLGLLPVPYYPQMLQIDVPSLRMDSSGMIGFSGYVLPGDSYRAIVAVPASVTASPGSPRPVPTGTSHALRLPETLPARVRHLAERIIAEAGAETPTMKAIAIENYLRDEDHFTYDLQAPYVPEGQDFVDHFLFVSRRGYCNHFATAMAVMLRTLGIPTRLATGFTSGEYRPDRDIYEIRDQDAHAWVEVFLPDTGWVDFDPTPDIEDEERSATDRLHNALTHGRHWLSTVWPWAQAHALLLAALIASLVLAITVGVHGARWSRERIPRLRRGASAGERVIHAYRQALRLLERAGLARAPSAAPWEYHRSTRRVAPAVAQDLAVLTEKYVRARFGIRPLADDAAAAAEAALIRLRAEIVKLNDGNDNDGDGES